MAFIYLSQFDFSRLAYWRRGFGVFLTFILVPPLLPYLISAIYSRSVVTQDRMRLAGFILVVILGSVLMGLLLVSAFGSISRVTQLALFAIQAFIYSWAAELLLHVE